MANAQHFSNGILIEQTVDNGDGTGTRTTFHPDGTVDTVEQLTGLPIPPPPEPDPMADLQAQLAAQQTLIDELLAALRHLNGELTAG